MNLLSQCCSLAVLIVVLGEMAEVVDAYRPYKHYRRRPQPRRPRWHPYSRSSKYYRSKRYPSEDYRHRRPAHYEYSLPRDDFENHPAEAHPYTIVIQLPKKEDKYNRKPYQRNYDREDSPAYVPDDDYIEEEDDEEDDDAGARMFRVDKKKVRVKVTKGQHPQLHIKISRNDEELNDLEIVDKANLTLMGISDLKSVHANFSLFTKAVNRDWNSTELVSTAVESVDHKIVH